MAPENKELLLKYLCMALPYDVVVRCYFVDGGGEEVLDTDDIADLLYNEENSEFPMYKPYLRPMSSMTEEEREQLKSLYDAENVTNESICFLEGGTLEEYEAEISFVFCYGVVDWLLKNYFDFMGLIPKGLAIEVNETNNPYK